MASYQAHTGHLQDQQKGDASAHVPILVQDVNTPAAHADLCHPVQGATTTVDGQPATASPASVGCDAGSMLQVASGNAFFQITVDIPMQHVHANITGHPTVLPIPTVTDAAPPAIQA